MPVGPVVTIVALASYILVIKDSNFAASDNSVDLWQKGVTT